MKNLIIVPFLLLSLFVSSLICPQAIADPIDANYLASPNDIVAFNKNSKKYHTLSCMWAKRCTKNCIKIKRSAAKKRGGVPCKVCGAGEQD